MYQYVLYLQILFRQRAEVIIENRYTTEYMNISYTFNNISLFKKTGISVTISHFRLNRGGFEMTMLLHFCYHADRW